MSMWLPESDLDTAKGTSYCCTSASKMKTSRQSSYQHLNSAHRWRHHQASGHSPACFYLSSTAMRLPVSYLGACLCALDMAACSLALLSPHHSTRKDNAQGHRTSAPHKRTVQGHRTRAPHKAYRARVQGYSIGSPFTGTAQGTQTHQSRTPPMDIAQKHRPQVLQKRIVRRHRTWALLKETV